MGHRVLWTAAIALAAVAAAPLTSPKIGAQAPKNDAAFWLHAFDTHQSMTAASAYRTLSWSSIGPANLTGRTTSIAVGDQDGHRVIYVGAATGGVWKSDDRGETWQPVFEHEPTASIGDVAVAPSNNSIVWVGTGEDNLFRAGLEGTGIYKSTDAGKSWTHMGLTDSGTIGRILVHPTNPDIVYVAVSGHEWTDNEMRGVFKTTDGGRTWAKVLYRSPSTGAVDLVMDPSDPNTIYAGMWQRIRRKWSDPRVEPGHNEGGIWKTTDGGKTWSPANSGLTPAEFRGRVGVDVSRSNPNVVYAVIDSSEPGRPVQPGERDAYGRPLPAGSNIIKGLVVFRSDDKGGTWRQVSGQTPQTAVAMMGLGNTYSWVFAQIRVDPKDVNTVYVQALATSVSHDGGATFSTYAGSGGDNHRLWIDPTHPETTYIAHDGGFTMTDDGGQTNHPAHGIDAAQFYNVEVDTAKPFHVYGSVQDTGSHRVALDVSQGWTDLKPLNWEGAPGGEGSNQAIDGQNPNIVYSHGYYGNFTRADMTPQPSPAAATGGGSRGRGRGRSFTSTNIRPPDSDLRAQWMAPIIVSPFDHQTIYAGYQYLFRSHDMGGTWERISADLTSNDPKQMGVNPSAIPYQTITQIAESPKKQGLLYAGTDDGHLWITPDDGKSWQDLTTHLPEPARKWISRIVASRYDEATVYVAQRGREDDDFAPYLWKSTDYGKTWTSIVGNIPAGSVNVIREDPTVPNLLYAGNDFGVYVSTNGGARWSVLGGNLPTNEVSDLQIQPRDNVIVVATYGRGIWVMDATKVRAVGVGR